MRVGHIFFEVVVDNEWYFDYIFIYRSINKPRGEA